MKIWFGCTTLAWKDYKKYYFIIRNELVKQGSIILYDWIDYADEVSEGTRYNKRNPKVYDQVTEAITNADIVVIENTVPNFSTAHQINYALVRQKPTLVLRLHKDKTLFNDSYIESITDPNLSIREYDEKNIETILKKFIKINSLNNTQGRYNIVLERRHKYYLDWASQYKMKSRSELIRNFIENEMMGDEDFEKYISSIKDI